MAPRPHPALRPPCWHTSFPLPGFFSGLLSYLVPSPAHAPEHSGCGLGVRDSSEGPGPWAGLAEVVSRGRQGLPAERQATSVSREEGGQRCLGCGCALPVSRPVPGVGWPLPEGLSLSPMTVSEPTTEQDRAIQVTAGVAYQLKTVTHFSDRKTDHRAPTPGPRGVSNPRPDSIYGDCICAPNACL